MSIFITGNFVIVAICLTNPIKESSLPICHCYEKIEIKEIEREVSIIEDE